MQRDLQKDSKKCFHVYHSTYMNTTPAVKSTIKLGIQAFNMNV